MLATASSVRRRLMAFTGALLACCALSAHADFQSSITVSLISPGGISNIPGGGPPINAVQIVSPLNFGTGITYAGGGAVGTWLLDNESITFSGDTIRVRSYAGDSNSAGASITGFLGFGGEHAADYRRFLLHAASRFRRVLRYRQMPCVEQEGHASGHPPPSDTCAVRHAHAKVLLSLPVAEAHAGQAQH